MSDVILTAYCLAYNHEKYIRHTLEGFVNQKTDYKFKVIVHDDASTDKTADIIREYAEKYPDMIIPIFQSENQYSKHIEIIKTYIAPLIEGKYVAVCEGDDYWCDENKLQMQIAYMETHPECSMCVHNTELINEQGESLGRCINTLNFETDFTPEQVIEAGGGQLFQTSSFVYRQELDSVRPEAFHMGSAGDYPLAIYMSCCGKVHYFSNIMSKYRIGANGSWSVRTSGSKDSKNKFNRLAISSLENMNTATNGKYAKSFEKAKKVYKFGLMGMAKKTLSAVVDRDYRKLFISRLKSRLTR